MLSDVCLYLSLYLFCLTAVCRMCDTHEFSTKEEGFGTSQNFIKLDFHQSFVSSQLKICPNTCIKIVICSFSQMFGVQKTGILPKKDIDHTNFGTKHLFQFYHHPISDM